MLHEHVILGGPSPFQVFLSHSVTNIPAEHCESRWTSHFAPVCASEFSPGMSLDSPNEQLPFCVTWIPDFVVKGNWERVLKHIKVSRSSFGYTRSILSGVQRTIPYTTSRCPGRTPRQDGPGDIFGSRNRAPIPSHQFAAIARAISFDSDDVDSFSLVSL